MKRKHTALILALLMVMLALMPGCRTGGEGEEQSSSGGAEKTEPLRVFIDVEYGSNMYSRLKNELANYDKEYVHGKWEGVSLQDKIADMGGPSSVEIEIAPIREDERDVYLTSLRTEMMSGGGPDVFVCGAGIGYHMKEMNGKFIDGEYVKSEPLFNFPQQVMERNMFLALDDYIEKAQFMEWDKLTQTVMEAGKTEKGQLLLPMTYTVATTAFRKADVEHTLSKDMTWEDMLSGEPHMRLAAINGWSYPWSGLSPLADYEHDKLAMSEEEMARYFTTKLDNQEKYRKESDIPYTGYNLCVVDVPLSVYDERITDDDPLVLVPIYSRVGGYGAKIKSFAGINANTKHPDEAFWVVDYLLGEECQRSILYAFMTCGEAVPTLEGLMGDGKAVSNGIDKINGRPTWKMPDNLYEQFCAVRDNISFADFDTPLNHELERLYVDELETSLREPAQKSQEFMIHDAYMRMNMMLAES